MARRRPPAVVLLGACATVITLATFLVPTSPAVASGLARTSRAATPSTGTVTGTVTITGAPKGFAPALGAVGGCKTGSFATCSSPQLSLANGASYTLTVPDGTWHLQGFYILDIFGGAFLGSAATVTVQSDKTTTVNFTVVYKKPGSVKGTVSVTKIPSGVAVSDKEAIACPSSAPNPNAAVAGLVCAESDSSGTYSVTSLAPGTWILYASYVTKFGVTSTTKGTTVTVVSGTTKTVNLTTPYLPPTSGLVSGAAVVTSAPVGFNDEVGVLACKGATVSLTCPTLQEIPVGSSYQVPLKAGTWTLEMLYFLQPYGGIQMGPAKTVKVVAGKTMNLPLAVAYEPTGVADGSVTVTGAPSNVDILSYSVLACPVGSPYDGNAFDPQCASETSGVGSTPFDDELGAHAKIGAEGLRAPAVSSNREHYSIRLPKGKWLVYPGYTTGFGPTVSAKATPVTIAARTATKTELTLAYSTPTDGAVSGTTRLLDDPSESGGLYGVEACPSPASTTPGAVCEITTMQIGPTGDYELALPAGTWWVAELYWYDLPQGGGSFEGEPIAGPSYKVVVKAATSYVLNLSATYGSA